MTLNATNMWTWMTLTIRDPRTAFGLIKQAQLPIEASFMIVALAAAFWAILSGVFLMAIDEPFILVPISETEAMALSPLGPIASGLTSMMFGLGLGYCLYRVGRGLGGQGSLAEVLSLTAVLELVVAVLVVVQTIAGLALPLVALMLFVLALFVLVRGLGHVANVGHGFDDMGKAGLVTVGAFVMLLVMVFVASLVLGLLGIGPSGEVVPLPLEMINEL